MVTIQQRPLFRRGDLVLLAAIALLALGGFVLRQYINAGAAVAVIHCQGRPDQSVFLAQTADQNISLPGGVVVAVQNHSIGFLSSSCPDQLCVRAGMLSQPGQAALCLPQRVSVVIRGSGGTDADI